MIISSRILLQETKETKNGDRVVLTVSEVIEESKQETKCIYIVNVDDRKVLECYNISLCKDLYITYRFKITGIIDTKIKGGAF